MSLSKMSYKMRILVVISIIYLLIAYLNSFVRGSSGAR